jgi:uncharacterized membrane protein (Fun14 family)
MENFLDITSWVDLGKGVLIGLVVAFLVRRIKRIVRAL